MSDIQCDDIIIRAILSKTRQKIIKELSLRPQTITNLSKILEIHKSAIYNHMQILINVKIVQIRQTNNEFRYYELTELGLSLLNSKIIFLINF